MDRLTGCEADYSGYLRVLKRVEDTGGVPGLMFDPRCAVRQSEILRMATEAFSFLTNAFGFQADTTNEFATTTVLRYYKNDVGIEVELEWRLRDATVLIVRRYDQEWPNGYYITKNGTKCRIYLGAALRLICSRQPVRQKMKQRSPTDAQMLEEITRQSRILRDLASDLESYIHVLLPDA